MTFIEFTLAYPLLTAYFVITSLIWAVMTHKQFSKHNSERK